MLIKGLEIFKVLKTSVLRKMLCRKIYIHIWN